MSNKIDIRNRYGLSLFSIADSGQAVIDPLNQNVGIGTVSPEQKLDVDGNIRAIDYYMRGSVLNSVLVVGDSDQIIKNSTLKYDSAGGLTVAGSITALGGTLNSDLTVSNLLTAGSATVNSDLTVSTLFVTGTATIASVDSDLSVVGDISAGGLITSGVNNAGVVVSDTTVAGSGSNAISNIVTILDSDYTALGSIDSDTLYIVL